MVRNVFVPTLTQNIRTAAVMSNRCAAAVVAAAIGTGSGATATYLTTRHAQFGGDVAYNTWFMPPSLYVRAERDRATAYITNTVARGVIADPLAYIQAQLTWKSDSVLFTVDQATSFTQKSLLHRQFASHECRDGKWEDSW